MSESEKPAARLRGFATLSPERHKEIASAGGRAVPPEKRSFSTNRDLARSAGTKGGKSVDPAKRSFSLDRQKAIQAGRKGGIATSKKDFSE